MHRTTTRRGLRNGFTLIELMIVVAIVGILASTAIPMLATHQLRTKATEAKTNLSAIRVVQEAAFSENGAYVRANAEPAVIPGTQPTRFDAVGSDFSQLGWAPEGLVYFSYAVEVSADASGYTADAAADIDGDGVVLFWGYAKPDGTNALVAGGLGCPVAALTPEVLGSCVASHSIF